MQEEEVKISGQIVDVVAGAIFPGELIIQSGRIKSIKPLSKAPHQLIMPGLVDAHIHIESSMLVPSEFARLAVVHGTIATVSDPHEIANVCGIAGVEYMLENARQSPFYFNFGAPSCVPATGFETAGATIGPEEIDKLLSGKDITYLAEMMNYPGVLNNDPDVIEKIKIARKYNKPVDGHAPGLKGDTAAKYVLAGISTDHECFTREEAEEKLEYGMKILIREGSAAKNFNALIGLIATHPDKIMFCSDDKHPDELVYGHINELVRRALIYDYKAMDVFRAATLNPVRHYGLRHGLLQKGDPADFIIVNNLEDFEIEQTWIRGKMVAKNGKTLIPYIKPSTINNFNRTYIGAEDLSLKAESDKIRVIEAIDSQLITTECIEDACIEGGKAISDVDRDILKMVIINRYDNSALPAFGFVKNFGLKQGAIASTVAHDSHNIIAVGVDDESLARAINLVIDCKGGISYVSDDEHNVLPLPIAGLMSNEDGYAVAEKYENIDAEVKNIGCNLSSPFMTLSFLALLVIPQLKLSDKGLFDGTTFRFSNVFV
jgi:adenine deaminase